MKTSLKGLLAIVNEEALVLSAYADARGVQTIGVGHTAAAGGIHPVPGMVITIEQALAQFAEDIVKFERLVLAAVTRPLTQNEFDALVSFEFNTGAIAKGTVDDKLNAGDITGAMATLAAYRNSDGKTLADLVARRGREIAMFENGTYPDVSKIKVYDRFPGPLRMVPVLGLHWEALTGVPASPAPVPPPVGQAPLAPRPAAPPAAAKPSPSLSGWLASIFNPKTAPLGPSGDISMNTVSKLNIPSLAAIAGAIGYLAPIAVQLYGTNGIIAMVVLVAGFVIQMIIPAGSTATALATVEAAAPTVLTTAEAIAPNLAKEIEAIKAGLAALQKASASAPAA